MFYYALFRGTYQCTTHTGSVRKHTHLFMIDLVIGKGTTAWSLSLLGNFEIAIRHYLVYEMKDNPSTTIKMYFKTYTIDEVYLGLVCKFFISEIVQITVRNYSVFG